MAPPPLADRTDRVLKGETGRWPHGPDAGWMTGRIGANHCLPYEDRV